MNVVEQLRELGYQSMRRCFKAAPEPSESQRSGTAVQEELRIWNAMEIPEGIVCGEGSQML